MSSASFWSPSFFHSLGCRKSSGGVIGDLMGPTGTTFMHSTSEVVGAVGVQVPLRSSGGVTGCGTPGGNSFNDLDSAKLGGVCGKGIPQTSSIISKNSWGGSSGISRFDDAMPSMNSKAVNKARALAQKPAQNAPSSADMASACWSIVTWIS